MSALRNFFAFRTMWTPKIIRVIYVIVAILILVGTIAAMVMIGNIDITIIIVGLVGLVIGQVFWRIVCELLIIRFAMHESIVKIRQIQEAKEKVEANPQKRDEILTRM